MISYSPRACITVCPLGIPMVEILSAINSYVVGTMAKGGDLGAPIIRLVLFITGILLLQMADTYCLRTYGQILFLFRNKQGERLMKKRWRFHSIYVKAHKDSGSLRRQDEQSMRETRTGLKSF